LWITKKYSLFSPNIAALAALRVFICYNIRMTNTKTNIQSKSILARLLANEDITVNHKMEAETASFDTKNRVLTLPCWKDMGNSLYDMLVGHEVAHALYTPTGDGWVDSIENIAKDLGIDFSLVKQYVNVVEDARIERMIKSQFPGLRRDFFNAYVDLLERDLFGIDGKDPADLTLIDRINLHYKLGLHANITIPFHPTELVWTSRIDTLETWEDVLDCVRDMMESLADDNEQSEPEQDETEQGDGEEGVSGESQESDESGDESSSGSESDSEDGEGESASDESGEGEEAEGGEVTTNTRGIEESITENAVSKASDDMKQDRERWNQPRDTELPTCNLDKCIIGYKKIYKDIFQVAATSPEWLVSSQSTREFVANSRKVVNVLAKQFEMKKAADAHRRVQISKTGTLDTVKMMNYKWSEDVFRKAATVREGKNHGLVMFLDWSGSMQDNITQTMDQMIQLVLFCKKVNIPFDVYAFSSHHTASDFTMWSDYDKVSQYSRSGMGSFNLFNLFSCKMSKTEMDAAIMGARYMAESQRDYRPMPNGYGLGGTPLDEAVLAAFTLIPRFREEHRVQIVNSVFMTDGCSNGNGIGRKDYLRTPSMRMGVQGKHKTTTGNLIELLQKETNSKAVGMFLSNLGPARFNNSYDMCNHFEPKDREAATKTWKSDNYAISTIKNGYAEHFMVRGNKKVDNNGLEDLPQDASTTKIKNAFLKSAGNKMTSRIVLNRFIDVIA